MRRSADPDFQRKLLSKKRDRRLEKLRKSIPQKTSRIEGFRCLAVHWLDLLLSGCSFMQFKDEGNTAFRQGNWTLAQNLYSQALTHDPRLAAARANRAACSINLQQWEQALNDCDVCLKSVDLSEPLLIKVLWRRCVCLRNLGLDKSEWQATIERALKLDSSNTTLLDESRHIFVHSTVPVEYVGRDAVAPSVTQKPPPTTTHPKPNTVNSLHTQRSSKTSGSSSIPPRDILPSLPLTYNGVLKLVRNKTPQSWDFWYSYVSEDQLKNALSASGVEPEVLDYVNAMIIANPQQLEKNREIANALSKLPRFHTALLMADSALRSEAAKLL